MDFDNLQHTRVIATKTFVAKYTEDDQVNGQLNILSEGAYRIGFAFVTEPLGGGICEVKLNGASFILDNTESAAYKVDPQKIMWLDGDPSVIRNDDMTFKISSSDPENEYLIIFFDRVQFKRDDILYPAQVESEDQLNNRNQ